MTETPTFGRLEPKPGFEELWGRLVKTWATGISYFKEPGSPVQIADGELLPPRDMKEFREHLDRVQLTHGMNIPSHITAIAIIQFSPEVFVLRLPPKVLIEQGEKRIGEQDAYPIPSFYRSRFEGASISKEERLQLHAKRIGEYTINTCI